MAPALTSLPFLVLRHLGEDHSGPTNNTSTDINTDMSHNHDGTNTNAGGDGHTMMNMVFHTSTGTTLFAAPWTPSNTGEYVGTVIFLIVLAFIQRFLVAFKAIQEKKWRITEKGRVIVIAGKNSGGRGKSDGNATTTVDTASINSVVQQQDKKNLWSVPWRFSMDLPRAGLQVLVSGLGYLLMLAVMTFNVGFFLAVLAGLFLGELAFGRFHKHSEH